jgi:CRISPR-associated protein Csm4
MATFKGYKLRFRDGLHIDAGGFGMENTTFGIASDTLMSAVCCCVKLLFGDATVKKLLDTEGSISSAFPFQEDVLYFPKPLTTNQDLSFSPYSDDKRFRKARFLTNDTMGKHFSKSLNGTLNETDFKSVGQGLNVFPSTKAFMQTTERPRIAVDRINSATTIFPFAQLSFDSTVNCGFFFLTNFEDPSVLTSIFEPALRLLGDEGIGADATIGKGLFEVEAFNCIIDMPTDANAHLLLSLYNPKDTEIEDLNVDNSTYELIVRNGWISSGSWETRRQSVRMMREGSVLSFSKGNQPIGNVPQVVQGSEVYRWGRAFALPIKIKEQ